MLQLLPHSRDRGDAAEGPAAGPGPVTWFYNQTVIMLFHQQILATFNDENIVIKRQNDVNLSYTIDLYAVH